MGNGYPELTLSAPEQVAHGNANYDDKPYPQLKTAVNVLNLGSIIRLSPHERYSLGPGVNCGLIIDAFSE